MAKASFGLPSNLLFSSTIQQFDSLTVRQFDISEVRNCTHKSRSRGLVEQLKLNKRRAEQSRRRKSTSACRRKRNPTSIPSLIAPILPDASRLGYLSPCRAGAPLCVSRTSSARSYPSLGFTSNFRSRRIPLPVLTARLRSLSLCNKHEETRSNA